MKILKDLPPADSSKSGWPWVVDEKDIQSFDPSVTWPKVSIVTPSFNQGRYIEETIRSVLLQNYPNLEYIIIDGGSTDETKSIIKKYDPWVTCWVSEPDSGQSEAINKGIKKSTGEIFNWLNSDDWFMPGTLFEVATAFMDDPSLQVVSGFENHIYLDGEIKLQTGTFLGKTLEETIERCEVAQPSTFFKLSSICEAGGVSEDLHFIMDGELWIKLLLLYGQHHFCKIEKPLVNFRFHENSKTTGNTLVNNFLFERSSIVSDLQRFAGVPDVIVDYFINEIYQTPRVYKLNRLWQINENVITKKKLKIYFIRKYVMKQFRRHQPSEAYWGLKKLLKTGAIDLYLFKGFAKLLLKTYRYE